MNLIEFLLLFFQPLSKKSMTPTKILVGVVMMILVVGIVGYVAFELFGLSSKLLFFECNFAARGRNIALQDFLDSGDLSKELLGNALINMPLFCGMKGGVSTQRFEKVSGISFLSQVSDDAQNCWQGFMSGEGDFAAEGVRNPFICSNSAYEIKDEVSISLINSVLQNAKTFTCQRGSYHPNLKIDQVTGDPIPAGEEPCTVEDDVDICPTLTEASARGGYYECEWKEDQNLIGPFKILSAESFRQTGEIAPTIEYFSSIQEDYRTGGPNPFDVSFSGKVTVFIDYFDYGQYTDKVKNCGKKTETTYSVSSSPGGGGISPEEHEVYNCDSISTIECGALNNIGSNFIDEDIVAKFGNIANFCSGRESISGLKVGAGLDNYPTQCGDAVLVCLRFEDEDLVKFGENQLDTYFEANFEEDENIYDYKCLDIADIVEEDMVEGSPDGISSRCPSNKVIDDVANGRSFVFQEFTVCSGGDSCAGGDFKESLELQIHSSPEFVKDLEFSWKNEGKSKIIVSYCPTSSCTNDEWLIIYELDGLSKIPFPTYTDVIQINDNVVNIKFECIDNGDSDALCHLSDLLKINYVTS